MRKFYVILICLFLTFLYLTPMLPAQEYKVITLKDGSIIKGKILSLTDNIYSVETTNLGTLHLNDTNIVSIKAESADAPANPSLFENKNNLEKLDKTQIQNQVNRLQGQIFANQDIMKDIAALMEDAEVKQLLQDPELMDAVMSYDANRIEQNEKMQKLMQNPKIQQLINKISQKVSLPK